MANKINWDSNPSLTAYLSTTLNTLANAGQVIGDAIDNSTALNMYMDAEVLVAVQGSARSAGAHVAIYAVQSLDGGTNYGYGDAAINPPASALVWVLPVDAATGARYLIGKPALMAPGHLKLVLENNTGQAFAGSGNTLKYRVYSEEIQ